MCASGGGGVGVVWGWCWRLGGWGLVVCGVKTVSEIKIVTPLIQFVMCIIDWI